MSDTKVFRKCDIEDTFIELCADCTALTILFDCWHNDVDYNKDDLQHLCWDRLSFLQQHIFDLGVLTGLHISADTDVCSDVC